MAPVIVTFSGSFCPPHLGHLDMIISSRLRLIEMGYEFLLAVWIPSTDGYVRGKVGERHHLNHEQRCHLCRLMSSEYPWITVSDMHEASSRKIAHTIYLKYRQNHPGLKVFELCGSDYALKTRIWTNSKRNCICVCRDVDELPRESSHFVTCRKVRSVSSTQIRSGESTDDLHPKVAKYLRELDYFET